MSVPAEPTRDRQLVATARAIEVLAARRRRLLTQLREIDTERKRLRKFLDDMLQPELPAAPERGVLPGDDTPNGARPAEPA